MESGVGEGRNRIVKVAGSGRVGMCWSHEVQLEDRRQGRARMLRCVELVDRMGSGHLGHGLDRGRNHRVRVVLVPRGVGRVHDLRTVLSVWLTKAHRGRSLEGVEHHVEMHVVRRENQIVLAALLEGHGSHRSGILVRKSVRCSKLRV